MTWLQFWKLPSNTDAVLTVPEFVQAAPYPKGYGASSRTVNRALRSPSLNVSTTSVRRVVVLYARMVSLDLTPFSDALAQLDAGLKEALEQPQSELLRDGVIQRFEYSHELALKFIRRALETYFGDPVDQMTYNDVLRTAAERALINDTKAWFGYRAARNKTSHTYDAAIAAEVFGSALPFLRHGRELFLRLDALTHRSAA